MIYPIIIILSLIGGMIANPVRNLIAGDGHKRQESQQHSVAPQEAPGGIPAAPPSRYHAKLSAAYLQKAYHSINQSLHYIETSEKTKQLPLFDYAQLKHDLERIKAELGKYLYPEEKDYGEAMKVTIDGGYFLEGIRSVTKEAPGPPQPVHKDHKEGKD